MDDVQILTDIGLSEKEARIYLCLLETGPTSSHAVSLKTGIKRSTVYFVLDELIERALVMRVARKRKQLFAARSPNDLLNIERGRMRRLADLVPTLVARAASHVGNETRTLLFEGVSGMREAYFYRIDELHGKELLGLYGTTVDVTLELDALIHEWNEYNANHCITTRALVPDHPSLTTYRALDEEHKRTVRIFPYEQYSSDTSMEITGQFVRIHMFGASQSLIIESDKIALVWRQLFEILWAGSAARDIEGGRR